MAPFFSSEPGWIKADLQIAILDEPPPLGFDCGRAEQNEFLYERALHDARALVSVTWLLFVKGIFAAYVTTTPDLIELGTREKASNLRYARLPGLKLAQLTVDRRFAGSGLGRFMVGPVIAHTRRTARRVGWRYVTLDARPELEGWYAAQGFVRNKVAQKRKVEHARATGRDEATLTVSMRYDLLG